MRSTFLKSGPQHFTSKNSFFGPPSGKKMRHFGHFRPPWNLKNRRKNEYNLFMSPNKPEGPPTKPTHVCIIPAIWSLRSNCLTILAYDFYWLFAEFSWIFLWSFMICNRFVHDCLTIFHRFVFSFMICLWFLLWFVHDFLWLIYDCFMMFMLCLWFFHDCLCFVNASCMISCRFFDEIFTDCLMILRCFRCVFF